MHVVNLIAGARPAAGRSRACTRDTGQRNFKVLLVFLKRFLNDVLAGAGAVIK